MHSVKRLSLGPRFVLAETRYDDRELRVRLGDDGNGIDPWVLQAGGSVGHWGFRGVRERAQQIGARLDFWSEAGACMEAELTLPVFLPRLETSRTTLLSRMKKFGIYSKQYA